MNPTTAEIVAYLREKAKQRQERAEQFRYASHYYTRVELEQAYARGLTEAANEIEARW